MPTHLDVIILSQADSAAGKRLVATATPENIVVCDKLTVGVLEGGMNSGATSVMLMFVDPASGQHFVVETSAKLFDGVAGAVQGAVQRFGK